MEPPHRPEDMDPADTAQGLTLIAERCAEGKANTSAHASAYGHTKAEGLVNEHVDGLS